MSDWSVDLMTRMMRRRPQVRTERAEPTDRDFTQYNAYAMARCGAADAVGLAIHVPSVRDGLKTRPVPDPVRGPVSDVACFASGTQIATPRGDVAVEDLRVGDKVITRDSGVQRVRWIARRGLTGAELVRTPHIRPVRIARDALAPGQPSRDLVLSPNHRVLVSSERTAMLFQDEDVLVAVKHLVGQRGITQADLPWVTYVHLLFDAHEIVLSDGLWTESFRPSQRTLNGLGSAQRQEIYELFPELKTASAARVFAPARRCLTPSEARFAIL